MTMRYFFSSAILLTITCIAFSQNNPSGLNDTAALKIKLKEYTLKLKEADEYESKTEAELKKSESHKTKAKAFLDSATVEAHNAQLNYYNSKFYLMRFDMYYNESAKHTKLADSLLKVAQGYKDSANLLNKKAEEFYFTIANEYTYVMKYDSINNTTYVVQLGAGKMDLSYFNKVRNVEVITPSDNIKRFIVGPFTSREDALEYKKQMLELGYKDSFVRTSNSLQY